MRHLGGIGFFAVATEVADAGGTVAVEEVGEDFADDGVVGLALLHVLFTVGTCTVVLVLAAFADAALLEPFVLGLIGVGALGHTASWALAHMIFPAGSAVESTGSNQLRTIDDGFQFSFHVFNVLVYIAPAKVRISERKTKKNLVFLVPPNESTFETKSQGYE